MDNDGLSSTIANNPAVLWALLAAGILTIIFGALNKSTSSVGAWLSSLRRISADSKEADLVAREQQIINLSKDLSDERKARQKDRQYFEKEVKHRDDLARDHIRWDWKVYNTLVHHELWDDKQDGPPPLF